jgi:hypothetical protein
MSEIFGVVCAKDAFKDQGKAIEEQKKGFDSMLLFSQDSGEDATGIFLMGRDDKDSKGALFKMDLPAKDLMARGEYLDLCHRFFGKSLQFAIGHCRKASRSAPASDKNNNHPINVRGVVGAHLGSITNHESLWKDHGGRPNHAGKSVWRTGDVDSEIIFFLIGKALRADSTTTLEGAIVEASKELKGTYACAAVDLWRPKYVMLFTNQKNKMYYYYSPSLKQILFATRFEVLAEALRANGFIAIDNYKNELPPHSGLRINADTLKLRPFVLASEEVVKTEASKIVAGHCGFGV